MLPTFKLENIESQDTKFKNHRQIYEDLKITCQYRILKWELFLLKEKITRWTEICKPYKLISKDQKSQAIIYIIDTLYSIT